MFSAYIDQLHFKTVLNLDFISVVLPYVKFTPPAVTSCRALYEYILCTENNGYCLKKKYIRLRAWDTVISICSLTNIHILFHCCRYPRAVACRLIVRWLCRMPFFSMSTDEIDPLFFNRLLLDPLEIGEARFSPCVVCLCSFYYLVHQQHRTDLRVALILRLAPVIVDFNSYSTCLLRTVRQ